MSQGKKLVPFRRDALFLSVYESCKHRPSALIDASNLTGQILSKLLQSGDSTALISRTRLVATTGEVLKAFDKTAAAVYAAYHQL